MGMFFDANCRLLGVMNVVIFYSENQALVLMSLGSFMLWWDCVHQVFNPCLELLSNLAEAEEEALLITSFVCLWKKPLHK